jgi:hypothetical protein
MSFKKYVEYFLLIKSIKTTSPLVRHLAAAFGSGGSRYCKSINYLGNYYLRGFYKILQHRAKCFHPEHRR